MDYWDKFRHFHLAFEDYGLDFFEGGGDADVVRSGGFEACFSVIIKYNNLLRIPKMHTPIFHRRLFTRP